MHVKLGTNVAIAFGPAGGLIRVDMERRGYVGTAEIGGDVREVGGPVHATGWVSILLPNIVHVEALQLAIFSRRGRKSQKVLQNRLAGRDVNWHLLRDRHVLLANAKLGLEFSSSRGSLLNQLLREGELQVCVVLVPWGNPAVADEEAG